MAATEEVDSKTGRGWRHWLARTAFELALIVFSVFLALALDSWRQQYQTAHKIHDVRAYFVEEIRANRAELASPYYLPVHAHADQAWAGLSERASPTVADLSLTWRNAVPTGFHTFQPRNAVWRSFASSDLMQHMPSREVFALADVYRLQDELAEMNRGLMSDVLVVSADAEQSRFIKSQAVAVHARLTDVTYAEHRLIADYDRTLALLAKDGGR